MGKNIIGELKVNGKIIDGNPIVSVNSVEDIPNNVLGLYKVVTEDGRGIDSSLIYEVSAKLEGEPILFEKITDSNYTQITGSIFSEYDSSIYNYVSTSIQHTNIYTLKYTYNGETIENGIRIGKDSLTSGSMSIISTKPGYITFRKYFSFNPSTGEIIEYDSNAYVVVNGKIYRFKDDTTPLIVPVSSGTTSIYTNYGRVILESFDFGTYTTKYEKKQLARVEELPGVQRFI